MFRFLYTIMKLFGGEQRAMALLQNKLRVAKRATSQVEMTLEKAVRGIKVESTRLIKKSENLPKQEQIDLADDILASVSDVEKKATLGFQKAKRLHEMISGIAQHPSLPDWERISYQVDAQQANAQAIKQHAVALTQAMHAKIDQITAQYAPDEPEEGLEAPATTAEAEAEVAPTTAAKPATKPAPKPAPKAETDQ
ncbi:hypothetical protein [Thalassovita sp.]|uniref:hypothetical protein n=1 Tax=Thalassovita sp. TaxID=1979401 RepID=UPI002AB1EF8C|nr:hypothetical protein [Thalassovita sp.]